MFGPGDDGWLQQARRDHYPPERNQVPAHLTLFHHLPPGESASWDSGSPPPPAAPPPRATIPGLIDLGGGTAYRVESEDLEDIRAEIADAFYGLLIPQDMAPWRPHITIQNKVEPREAKALQQRLRATFAPRPLAIGLSPHGVIWAARGSSCGTLQLPRLIHLADAVAIIIERRQPRFEMTAEQGHVGQLVHPLRRR